MPAGLHYYFSPPPRHLIPNLFLIGPPGSGKGSYGKLLAQYLQIPLWTASSILQGEQKQRKQKQREHHHHHHRQRQQQQKHQHHHQKQQSSSSSSSSSSTLAASASSVFSSGSLLDDQTVCRVMRTHLERQIHHQRQRQKRENDDDNWSQEDWHDNDNDDDHHHDDDDDDHDHDHDHDRRHRYGRNGDVMAMGPFLMDGFPRTMSQVHAMEREWPDGFRLGHAIHLDVPREVCEAKLLGRRLCSRCGGNWNTSRVIFQYQRSADGTTNTTANTTTRRRTRGEGGGIFVLPPKLPPLPSIQNDISRHNRKNAMPSTTTTTTTTTTEFRGVSIIHDDIDDEKYDDNNYIHNDDDKYDDDDAKADAWGRRRRRTQTQTFCETPELCRASEEHWTTRSDDAPHIVSKRLDIYYQMTEPIVRHYERRGALFRFTPYKGFDDVPRFREELSRWIARRGLQNLRRRQNPHRPQRQKSAPKTTASATTVTTQRASSKEG